MKKGKAHPSSETLADRMWKAPAPQADHWYLLPGRKPNSQLQCRHTNHFSPRKMVSVINWLF